MKRFAQPTLIVLASLIGLAACVGPIVWYANVGGAPESRGRVGIRRIDDSLVIRVLVCDEHQSVEIVELEDERDRTVWRIESETPTSIRSFVVGETPGDFLEAQGLTGLLQSQETHVLKVTVSDSPGILVNEFEPAGLDRSLWDVTGISRPGDRLSDEELEALEPC